MKILPDIISKGNLTYKNYTLLNEKEKKTALEFRNKNRSWMINQDLIGLKNHLSWIEKLKNCNDTIYFLVFKNNIAFMSIDFHNINWDKKECFWGYFLGIDSYKSEVLQVEKDIIDIGFNTLKMKKLLNLSLLDNHVIQIHKFFGFKEDKEIIIDDRKYLQMYLTRNMIK